MRPPEAAGLLAHYVETLGRCLQQAHAVLQGEVVDRFQGCAVFEQIVGIAFLLARDGPGPRLTWHDGEAPPDAWGRAQAWPGGVAGAPAFAWDRAFGLGAGAEAAALVALAQRTGALAGPGVWVEVG